MDNEIDQVMIDLTTNDKVATSAAKSTDDDLDAALVDMVAILPDF